MAVEWTLNVEFYRDLARTYMIMPHMASSGCWSDTGEDNGVVLVYFRPSCGRRALTDLARWLICQ